MSVTFFDRQDEANPQNGVVVESEEALVSLLESLTTRTPFFCELMGQNDQNLLVGLGGLIGCVQYSSADGMPPYWMAVGQKSIDGPERFVEFLMGGTGSPFSERFTLPIECVRHIATHFFRSGERSCEVEWEEV